MITMQEEIKHMFFKPESNEIFRMEKPDTSKWGDKDCPFCHQSFSMIRKKSYWKCLKCGRGKKFN